MNEIRKISPEEEIDMLIESIFCRGDNDYKIMAGQIDRKLNNLICKVVKMYYENIKKGVFVVDEITDEIHNEDEDTLFEAANIMVSCGKIDGICLEKDSSSYDDIVDEIINELIMSYDIRLWDTRPPYSHTYMPEIVIEALKRCGGAYYAVYPPAGSFAEYNGEAKTEMWYNDCQNVFDENLVMKDNYDDAIVMPIRLKNNEKIPEVTDGGNRA